MKEKRTAQADATRVLIERYLHAYNTFDVEGTGALIREDITFMNTCGGEVNTRASGAAFRTLVEQGRGPSSSRGQVLRTFEASEAWACWRRTCRMG